MPIATLATLVASLALAIGSQHTVGPHGATPRQASDTDPWTSAVQFGLQGHLQPLRQHLSADSSMVSTPISSTGATALHFASAKGLLEMVRMLLASGASVSATTAGGATPLAMACSAVELEVAAVLAVYIFSTTCVCGLPRRSATVLYIGTVLPTDSDLSNDITRREEKNGPNQKRK